jgi:hypothetical protein
MKYFYLKNNQSFSCVLIKLANIRQRRRYQAARDKSKRNEKKIAISFR